MLAANKVPATSLTSHLRAAAPNTRVLLGQQGADPARRRAQRLGVALAGADAVAVLLTCLAVSAQAWFGMITVAWVWVAFSLLGGYRARAQASMIDATPVVSLVSLGVLLGPAAVLLARGELAMLPGVVAAASVLAVLLLASRIVVSGIWLAARLSDPRGQGMHGRHEPARA